MYQIKCPNCGCQDIGRVHRSRFDKICRRSPKFRCLKCRRKFFRKITSEKSDLHSGGSA